MNDHDLDRLLAEFSQSGVPVGLEQRIVARTRQPRPAYAIYAVAAAAALALAIFRPTPAPVVYTRLPDFMPPPRAVAAPAVSRAAVVRVHRKRLLRTPVLTPEERLLQKFAVEITAQIQPGRETPIQIDEIVIEPLTSGLE